MTFDEFSPVFQQLVNAFHVSKADKKIDVYFKHLQKMPFYVFVKSVEKCESDLDKFPTIAKIFETAASIFPPMSRKAQECNACDGFGTVSLWRHTFRARCLHGDQVSKSIARVPVSESEKSLCYEGLNREWNEIYNHDLVWEEFGTSLVGLDVIQKTKVTFDLATAPIDDEIRQRIKSYTPEKFIHMMGYLKSFKSIQTKQGTLHDFWIKWWKLGFEIHGKENLLSINKKVVTQ